MKEQDYSDYRITDLLRDLGDDASAIRSKLRKANRLRERFALLTAVWGYVSVLLFVVFGITYLLRTGEIVLPILAFSVSGLYLIVNTVMLALGRRRSEGRKAFNRAAGIVCLLLKLAMIGVTICSLIGGNDAGAGFHIAWCIVSVLWIGATVAIDVAYWIVCRIVEMLKELAIDRIRRTKAAFSNTKDDIVNFARTVKGIGSEIKELFVGKKKE